MNEPFLQHGGEGEGREIESQQLSRDSVLASIYQLKPAFQRLLRPIVRQMAAAGITANQVTVAAVVLSLAVGASILVRPDSAWPLLLLPVFLFLRMALNAMDGMLAREYGQQSRLGAMLNELGDAISDAALYLPLALVVAFNAHLIVVIVVLALISEMAGLVAVEIGAQRRYDGPMGKSDRAFVFGALALWVGAGGAIGPWLDGILLLTALLLAVTILRRARAALREGG